MNRLDLTKLTESDVLTIYKMCCTENDLPFAKIMHTQVACVLKHTNSGEIHLDLVGQANGKTLFRIVNYYHSSSYQLIIVEHNIMVKKTDDVKEFLETRAFYDPVMPLQPIKDYRFVSNRIVDELLRTSPLDLNDLAEMKYSNNEWEQFAQLIGYSVSGFGGLSYVSRETRDAADDISQMKKDDTRNIKDIHIARLTQELKVIKDSLKTTASIAFDMDEEYFEDNI